MATHPADARAENPRVQCSVCGKWRRQYLSKAEMSPGGYERTSMFFACSYTDGDHLAGDRIDVCDDCCHTHCRSAAAPTPPEAQ